MSERSQKLTEAFRRGGWLPAKRELVDDWVNKKVDRNRRSRGIVKLHPVLQELKDMIENDSDMYMGFNRMFEDSTTIVSPFPPLLFSGIVTLNDDS